VCNLLRRASTEPLARLHARAHLSGAARGAQCRRSATGSAPRSISHRAISHRANSCCLGHATTARQSVTAAAQAATRVQGLPPWPARERSDSGVVSRAPRLHHAPSVRLRTSALAARGTARCRRRAAQPSTAPRWRAPLQQATQPRPAVIEMQPPQARAPQRICRCRRIGRVEQGPPAQLRYVKRCDSAAGNQARNVGRRRAAAAQRAGRQHKRSSAPRALARRRRACAVRQQSAMCSQRGRAAVHEVWRRRARACAESSRRAGSISRARPQSAPCPRVLQPCFAHRPASALRALRELSRIAAGNHRITSDCPGLRHEAEVQDGERMGRIRPRPALRRLRAHARPRHPRAPRHALVEAGAPLQQEAHRFRG
jgi:hypothetical protein